MLDLFSFFISIIVVTVEPNDHMQAYTKTHVPQSQKYALMVRSDELVHCRRWLFLYVPRDRFCYAVRFAHASCQNKTWVVERGQLYAGLLPRRSPDTHAYRRRVNIGTRMRKR